MSTSTTGAPPTSGGTAASTSTGEPDPTTGEQSTTTGAGTTGVVGVCGDGVVEGSEQCDDGDDIEENACTGACLWYTPLACPADYVVCDDGLDLGDKSDPRHALAAMGICDDLGDNSVLVTDFTFAAPDPASWQVAAGFGSFESSPGELLYSPREGDTLLMISTGKISAPNPAGVVLEPSLAQSASKGNDNPERPNIPPSPIQPNKGSNFGTGGWPFHDCDGIQDCSDSLQEQWYENNGFLQDQLFFKLGAVVPLDTHGYSLDFVFCTSEWPEWVDTAYVDMFTVWQSDPTPGAYVGNVAYFEDPEPLVTPKPINATALDPYFHDVAYTFADPQLVDTGFDMRACSDWLTIKGSVQPGAHVTLAFFIANTGDSARASLAIVDNFRWDCAGCDPQAQGCGLQQL